MTSRVIHFDIPVDDPARAGAFYASVFDWTITPWGPIPYWPMTTGTKPARVTAAGGTVVAARMPIPTIGWTARFRDCEGNLIGLIQADPSVTLPGPLDPSDG
ncbi:hypothetical protein K2F54_10270 [Cryobacterium sp. 1639]|uniref:VOC family protein n=1 Tax=Cryobacterium inferilacus TaxID=2866629 RepID=UPI001C73D938|nr:hypothetical protein [Cryobacterium sp. 1639]MBX0300359.1 hypothetical protein [Cryobacterium sp. 1639]